MKNAFPSPRHRFDTRGFTFVEVIVVSLIILTLGAVAIPLYQGFATKQRKETVENLAQAAAVAANAHWRRHNTTPTRLDLNLFLPQENRFAIDIQANGNLTVTDTSVRPIIPSSVIRYRP